MASFNQLIDGKIANANLSCRDIFLIAQKIEKNWQKYQPDDISLDDLGKGKGFMASVLRLQFSMKDDTILSTVLKLAVKSGTPSEETIENTTLDGSSNTIAQPITSRDVKHIVETLNANQLQNIMVDLAKFHASVLDYETRNIDFLKQFPYDNDGVKQFVNCVSGLVWKLVEIEPNLHEMITILWPYISNPEVFIENISKKYGCITHPTHDIARLMALSVDAEIRRSEELNLLKLYYKTFNGEMQKYNKSVMYGFDMLYNCYKETLAVQSLHYLFATGIWISSMSDQNKFPILLNRAKSNLEDAMEIFKNYDK
uniref:Uncharacterized protein n=1 Tax=Acrobeloides nanus TaxID=290746 RepID=A0A914EJV2_9BILA